MTNSTAYPTIRAHVFYGGDARMFLKQAPGNSNAVDGVTFSFGLETSPDADVLIVYTRASFSVPTRLPQERTAFIAGEPDPIHRYNPAFLNQFGLVLTTSAEPLAVPTIRANYCSKWYAGIDYDEEPDHPNLAGHDYFSGLRPPRKTSDRISIVTSRKASTPYHKKRLEFIDFLRQRIPDRIDLYGSGHRYVGDKREALEPYKYHLALENGDGDFSWTEKLSDPLLCWTFPFYSGCGNVGDDLPAGCHMPLDLTDFNAALARMIHAVEGGQYETALDDIAEARRRILDHYNLMSMLARVARQAFEAAPDAAAGRRERLVYSERSFVPEDGYRGSRGQALLRRAILLLDPHFDLRLARLKEARSTARAHRLREERARAGIGKASGQV
ncbi:MAG: hypothetical protein WAU86_22545 [Oricola sp.]